MSSELEWKSFVRNKFPTNDGLSTAKAKIFHKDAKNKKIFCSGKPCPHKSGSGGPRVHSRINERCWTQADNNEERIAAIDDEKLQLCKYHAAAHAQSYSIPNTRRGSKAKSMKVYEKNKDVRKWTRDVIFEAEQIIIKSEIDNIEAMKPSFEMKESTDERILREPLGEHVKAKIKFERCPSSTPSLLNVYSADEVREVYSANEKDVQSKQPSALNVAKKIRSTSRSLRSLNNLGRSCRLNVPQNVPMSVKQKQREEGACALLRAAKNDSVFQIQTLVTHGGISTEILDQRGWTPLTIALENENMKCAEVLVQMSANAKFVHTNGMTILHHITSTGNYKGVKFLLRHGANVNVEDYDGWPPVHYALQQNHLKCTALLLAAGCDSQTYTQKRVKEYEEVVRLATIGKWKFHWQQKLDIDMGNEIQL